MRRDDARPPLSPTGLVACLAAATAPLVVWAAFASVWLAAALAILAAVLAWEGVRLARTVRAQESELVTLRSTDALTGLPNRRVWEDTLPRELARAIRTGSPVAIVLLRVDHFETYNDEHGNQAGDIVLKEMAALWPRELRDSDLLARFGGDRFALLLPDCGSADVSAVVEKVRSTVPPGVTCSAGVATWDGVEPAEALVARAADALASAESGGGDVAVVADVARPAGA